MRPGELLHGAVLLGDGEVEVPVTAPAAAAADAAAAAAGLLARSLRELFASRPTPAAPDEAAAQALEITGGLAAGSRAGLGAFPDGYHPAVTAAAVRTSGRALPGPGGRETLESDGPTSFSGPVDAVAEGRLVRLPPGTGATVTHICRVGGRGPAATADLRSVAADAFVRAKDGYTGACLGVEAGAAVCADGGRRPLARVVVLSASAADPHADGPVAAPLVDGGDVARTLDLLRPFPVAVLGGLPAGAGLRDAEAALAPHGRSLGRASGADEARAVRALMAAAAAAGRRRPDRAARARRPSAPGRGSRPRSRAACGCGRRGAGRAAPLRGVGLRRRRRPGGPRGGRPRVERVGRRARLWRRGRRRRRGDRRARAPGGGGGAPSRAAGGAGAGRA